MCDKVSIIIPTYNRFEFVTESVGSVLAQNVNNIEIIIIDDGSSDNTRQIKDIYKDQIVYLHQTNRGPSAARNAGVKAATGKYIAFLDSDDLYRPNIVQKHLERPPKLNEIHFFKQEFSYIDGHKDLLEKMVGGGVDWPNTDAEGWLSDAVGDIACGRYLQLNGMMCRRDTFFTVGPFDEALRAGEDEEWFFRAALTCKLRLFPEEMAIRRLHGAQTGLHKEKNLSSLIGAMNQMRTRAYLVGNKSAANKISVRLANQLSRLSNTLAESNRYLEASGLSLKSFFLNPARVQRLIKALIFLFKSYGNSNK